MYHEVVSRSTCNQIVYTIAPYLYRDPTQSIYDIDHCPQVTNRDVCQSQWMRGTASRNICVMRSDPLRWLMLLMSAYRRKLDAVRQG